MNEITNLFLSRRGYTLEYLNKINDPTHPKLQNSNKLAKILKHVHDTHARIVIMPDFDTDGISAGTVGFAGLSQLGFNVGLYCPIPGNGYGIKISDIKNVIKMWPDVKYIISCDVGITCYDAFEYAHNRGIHVLITDHHEEEAVKPKPLYCDVIVNPCQLSETYPLRNICGAFVFYQELVNYAQMYGDQITNNLIDALAVFAGIGTIGDMMDLVHENRVLVKRTVWFLKELMNSDDLNSMFPVGTNPTYKRAFIGLKVLLLEFHRNGKLRNVDDIDEKWLGWTLVPTYNSAKRLNLDMSVVFGIFFSGNTSMQADNANKLITSNEKRKVLTKEYLNQINDEILAKKQPWAPFIFITDATGGFLGPIANQLMKKSGLPTFVINKQTLSGSGRSLPYFPAFSAFQGTEFTIMGHEEAFGIRFTNLNQINRFYAYLVKNVIPLAKKASQESPKRDYDIMLTAMGAFDKGDFQINMDHDMQFYKDTLQLKPFGMGFNEPIVDISFNPQNSKLYTMGKEDQHLKIITPEGMQLLSWNNGKKINQLRTTEHAVFSGNFSVNHFRGEDHLQMIGDLKENNNHDYSTIK